MRSLTALAVAAGFILLGTASAPRSEADPSAPVPDPALASWPDWTLPVSCGWSEGFDPLIAFAGPTGAESGNTPAERALRRVIAEQRSWAEPLLAERGWRLIDETDSSAEFANGRLAGRLEWVTLERDPAGRWRLSGYSSDCDPTTMIAGRTVVTWSLARRQKRLSPRSRTLWIDLGPGECASGTPQNPRAGFRFYTLGTRLLMIVSLEPAGGGTCIGTVEPARKVRLPSALGGFRLYDGATFPPVPAGKTRQRR